MRLTFFLVLLVIPIVLTGQTKNEKEERVTLTEFPADAQTTLKQLPKHCKRLKFYKETDGDKQSYEVKFKLKRKRYSLEFSENGSIEDIEILVKLKSLAPQLQSKIAAYFTKNYKRYKLIKIQKQYIFSSTATPTQFLNNVLSQKPSILPNFEIIAEIKQKKHRQLGEFIFSKHGEFISYRPFKPTSYEHVLY